MAGHICRGMDKKEGSLTQVYSGYTINITSKLDDRAFILISIGCEESPGSIGQGRRVTPGRGDSKESATEINRRVRLLLRLLVRMER